MENESEKPGFVVKQYDELPELFFVGSHIRPLIGPEETKNIACYHLKAEPDVFIEQAFHNNAEELIWILKGGGVALFGHKEEAITAGTILFIRPSTPHGFRAGSDGLELLAITTPRVDSKSDYHPWGDNAHHQELKVLSGRWVGDGMSEEHKAPH